MHRFKSGRRLHPPPSRRPVPAVRIPLAVRITLAVAAAAMLISGYVWGDPVVIWQKAANICLECIGIG